jgi:hypothetical protein
VTTLGDYKPAAMERNLDAQAIFLTRPTSAGAIYMLGYAIEQRLKAACADAVVAMSGGSSQRWTFGTVADKLFLSELKHLANMYRMQTASLLPTTNTLQSRPPGHDLLLLVDALIVARKNQGKPFSPPEESTLRNACTLATTLWSVDLRYSPLPRSIADFQSLESYFHDVDAVL